MKKITAGRDILGEFAPKFAQLNDDVLFGEVWSRESELSARDRSLITVTALMAQGLTDTSFGHHLAMAKENGITRSEIAEILTHAAFYAGWPKAWAAFRMAKDVWADEETADEKQRHQNSMVFPIGAPNDGFAQYFSGQSYTAGTVADWVAQFSFGFYSLMLTSLLLGLIVMVLYKPRTWCAFCPMGTMTQGICKLKNKES